MATASAWGTTNATLSPAPAAPAPAGTSAWGTTNVTLTAPTPPAPVGTSSWGTADATLKAGGVVVWLDGAWQYATPVHWSPTTGQWTE